MWKWESDDPRGVFIIVHGAGEYHVRYEWLKTKLVNEGFHVILGDLPGQGKTRGIRGHIKTFDQYIETIESWYEEAKKYKLPIFLLGHSMGGLSVIRTLMEKKLAIKAAILSSPCLGLVNPPGKAKGAFVKALNIVTPSVRFNSGLPPGSGTRSEEMRQRDLKDPLLVKKVSVRWYAELSKAMKLSHQHVEKFPNVPLLVLQGGEDLIVKKEEVKNWFNHLRIDEKMYKEWPGLYHEVFNEPEQEKVFQYLRYFVDLQLHQF
ncbi:alpha/beta fold hydrolase [Anaerobacillus sp. MEB173]|uniref:alpha/beta fold hydrolase n=1 Tax=Anaerobacillus sp. MEB173 TaxID=3383345 RepID=UPI003F8F70CF